MKPISQRERFPSIPDIVLWKAEILFTGVRYTEALRRAVEEGATPNFYPYRRRSDSGKVDVIPVPYLFDLDDGTAVARVRVDDHSAMEVRRDGDGRYSLWRDGEMLCSVGFVNKPAWQEFRTDDGLSPFAAGVSQMGDMIVVNAAPGCEYFTVSSPHHKSMRCSFCGYGRFDRRSVTLGQKQGEVVLSSEIPARVEAVMRAASASPSVGHVYITGGSTLDPADEVERFLPVLEAVRRGVGDGMRVTIGSGAVDPAGSQRYRDAGADSACYNLEVWDPDTFETCCPGKAAHVGRQRWIDGLLGAAEIFGRGNVGSAFVAGLELTSSYRQGMSPDRMVASIVEGATFLLDHGVVPLYSPLWPVDGTVYKLDDGLTPELYLRLEYEIYKLRAERRFPVPGWLICPKCSYMLLEVDFDRAFGLNSEDETCSEVMAESSASLAR